MSTVSDQNITRKALLASNDAHLATLLPTLLAPTGYEVTTVAGGKYSKADANDYDILIIDGDPQLTFGEGLPAVVSVAPIDAIGAYDKGVDIVIDKPLMAKVFMAKIKAVLRRYGVEL